MKLPAVFRFRNLCIAFAAVLVVVVLCAVLAIYVLPSVLKPYLEEKLGAATGSEVHIGLVKIYPFKLALALQDFSAKNKAAKLNWDSLYIDTQLLSIPTRSVRLDELRIHGLRSQLILQNESKELSSIAEFATDAFLKRMNVPLYIERFIIQNGAFEALDKRGENEKRFGIAPISFSLEKFSTQYSEESGNNYNLQFTSLSGGFFRWNGNLQWNPFLSQGELEIRDLDIIQLRDFYREFLPFNLQSGKLDLRTNYRIVEEPEIGFVLENAKLSLNRPSLIVDSSNFEMRVASVHTDSLQISTLNRTLFAGNVIIDSVSARFAFDSLPNQPDPELFKFVKFNGDAADSSDANASVFKVFSQKFFNLPRWEIKMNSLQTKQMNIEIIDSRDSIATVHNLNDMQLFLTGITNHAEDSVHVAGSALFNGSNLDLQGTAHLLPLQADWNFNIKDYPLISLQNYISKETWLNLRQGQANAQLNMRWKPAANSALRDTLFFAGDVEIDNLNLLGKNNAELAKASKTSIKDINIMFMPNVYFQVSNIDIQTPVLNLIWYVNSKANYSQIKKTKSTKGTSTPFIINRIKFGNGTVYVADKDPATPFSYRIVAVQGNLRNLSGQKRDANLSMQGKMGGYAPFFLNGSINLFGKYPKIDFKVETANQDLTVLSPYSGKYAGYRIAKGQIAMQADYAMQNNKVHGNNHVVMQHLNFGEAVENSEATKLPVRLFAALLSDKDGIIDLDVAIEGDLDDPEFSVGSLIWKVIKNLLGKAVSAPFKGLMALVGSDSDPETIAFAPGSEYPGKENLESLKKLSQALMQRPQLQLDVYGNADSIQDGNALKETQLLKAIGRNVPAKLTPSAFEKHPLRDTLFAYYGYVPNAGTQEEASLVQAARRIWSELLVRQVLPPNALRQLAHTRAQNIKVELVNINPTLGERVFVVNEGTFSETVTRLKIREY
ncbi:hypothetical protein R83H12_02427 [Fibrobacteria bacterium R8-3-H12]